MTAQLQQAAESPAPPPSEQSVRQTGEIQSLPDGQRMSTATLNQIVSAPDYQGGSASFYLSDRQQRIINYVATGIDHRPYFSNSYLVGFVPFETDSIWVPLATLSMRKRYVLDHVQHGPGMTDIWQNSEQAYYYGHGDCEDHAVLLADWLIGLGYDARVVIGEIPQGGHAWVVLFMADNTYVLEATDKRKPTSINDFIPAARATQYRPRMQFNRTEFWENTGSTMTVDYRDSKWLRRSLFRPQPAVVKNQ
ncbi:hypothetical protein GCM10008090_26880 [Arenicella chitinivorans]|uniref:CEP76/DRC7 peptidase-like domain-containing protein n=2 Tax=Arenicella chitinivorans TaxID=1329800 RepID=A0A918RX09_9GAMM|nr:hypothetical protein GCM10008090_26880 [Arenicella chitinivorans]